MADMCIFCKIANGEIPSNCLYEDELVKVILDLSPASKGHALIIPKRHANDLFELDEETKAHVLQVASKVGAALKKTPNADGINIMQNNGEAAGQTVMHFHMHIIPRYKGDGLQLFPSGESTPEELKEIRDKVVAELN